MCSKTLLPTQLQIDSVLKIPNDWPIRGWLSRDLIKRKKKCIRWDIVQTLYRLTHKGHKSIRHLVTPTRYTMCMVSVVTTHKTDLHFLLIFTLHYLKKPKKLVLMCCLSIVIVVYINMIVVQIKRGTWNLVQAVPIIHGPTLCAYAFTKKKKKM